MSVLKPIYHRYELWEDYKMGMFSPQCHPSGVTAAYQLLRDLDRLEHAMWYVANHWPISAAVNLSNRGRNRQAWLGQASACWNVHATEEETKAAWRRLTKEEQDRANAVADKVTAEWEASFAKAKTLH